MVHVILFVLSAFTHAVLGKIEVFPLPQEEQDCFNNERKNGDFSSVVGHIILEKCVYATEMLKTHIDTSKFPDQTLKWFKGLIEQTLSEEQKQKSPQFFHYRGKRQARPDVAFGQPSQQPGISPGAPRQQPEVSFGTPQQPSGILQTEVGQDLFPGMSFGPSRQPPGTPFGPPQQQPGMPPSVRGRDRPFYRVRKEYRRLSDLERSLFHRAFQMLKADTSVSPSKFDALGKLHEDSVQRGHYGPAFLPWHRMFLLMVENALREKIPSVTIPYWDSTLDSGLLDPRSSIIWTPEFLGYGFGYLTNGPFAHWNTPYGQIVRSFGQEGALFNWTSINSSLSMNHLENISYPTATLENNFEEHHVQLHLWVGGFMAPPAIAAFDPIFYLLHAYVDLIWELFRNLQRRRGVDPTTDYPMDTNVTGHGYNDTAGLGNYLMHHGLSDHYTERIYKYEVPPSCTRRRPSCGSRYIRCDTKLKIPRCVSASIFDPIRMFTPRGIPMDGSSGIRELKKRSTRRRNRNRQRPTDLNRVPAEVFIDGSADLNYANTFVLDGRKDPNSWAYIPVNVKYQNVQNNSNAMVNDWCDKYGSHMKLSIVTDGLNYRGQYRHVQLVDTTKSEVTFTSLIGLRLPNKTRDTEVLVSAYDACGRMCQPVCSHKGRALSDNCSGSLKLTVERPHEYLTHAQKRLEYDETSPIRRQVLSESIGFLSFSCNSARIDWIW